MNRPKLYFYNNWHNGDILFSRPLVRRLLDRYDLQITWGCWRNHRILIQDLPVTIVVHANDDEVHVKELHALCPPDHHCLDLWIGHYPDTHHMCWRNVVEVYNRQIKQLGLDLPLTSHDVPMIDFPHVDMAVRNNAIYVENGAVRSQQCKFNFDMGRLCADFPDLNFYCTADPGGKAPNLFNCAKLNLVQLSALSNRCDALVGKGAGTFACAMTEPNRFKPQALMNFHSYDGPTFWDYPGCPTQYLERYEELRDFLQAVRRRPKIDLTDSANLPSSAAGVNAVVAPPNNLPRAPGLSGFEPVPPRPVSSGVFEVGPISRMCYGNLAIPRTYFGQFGEDRWIVENLPLPPRGYFVDVGGSDGISGSNTFYFERQGWSGVLLEPDPRNLVNARRNRSCRIDPRAVASARGTVDFRMDPDSTWSGIIRPVGPQTVVQKVQADTLTQVLVDAGAPPVIDLLSIDTEGTELEVWASLDKAKFRPKVVIVEFDTGGVRCDAQGVANAITADGYVLRHSTEANHIFVWSGEPGALKS